MDARRARLARCRARARADEEPGSADPRSRRSARARSLYKARRQVVRRRLQRADQGCRSRTSSIQAMLTLNLHKVPGYADVIRRPPSASSVRGIKEIGDAAARVRATRRASGRRSRTRAPGSSTCPSDERKRSCAAKATTRSCASRVTAPTARARRWPGRADRRDARAAAGRLAARARPS